MQKACDEDGVLNICLNKLDERLAPSIFLLSKIFTCKKFSLCKMKKSIDIAYIQRR